MKIGDRVSFMQQYGNPVLRIVKDEYHYVYRRRCVTGTIQKIVQPTDASEPIVTIKIDGAPQYGDLQGMPASKVQVLP